MASSPRKKTARVVSVKFTPQTRAQIIKLLRAGNYAATAARAAGIHPNTFWNWMKRGRAAKQGPYRKFFQDVESAQAVAEAIAVGNVQMHMAKNWRAALAYLERKFPKRWGARRLQLARPDHHARSLPVALRLKHDAEFLGQVACILDQSGSIESVVGSGSRPPAHEPDSPSSHAEASGIPAA